MKLIFIFVFSLGLFARAFAENKAGELACDVKLAPLEFEKLKRAYADAFNPLSKIYRPGQCGRNVKELALYLKKAGVNLVSAKVIFIMHEYQKYGGIPTLRSKLTPKYNRNNEPVWDFHVVLKVDDPVTAQPLILDLDTSAKPQGLREFFNKTFPQYEGRDRLAGMGMREFDLDFYLKAFEDYHARRSIRDMDDENIMVVKPIHDLDEKKYPIISVREYLKRN